VADEMGLSNGARRRWCEVQPGSYARRSCAGDMVTAINGQEVKSVADLKKRITPGVSSLSVGREGHGLDHPFR
jgi:S1-C subfamily serine protease